MSNGVKAQLAANFVRAMFASGSREGPPAIVAGYACDVVDALFEEFKQRGWLKGQISYEDFLAGVSAQPRRD